MIYNDILQLNQDLENEGRLMGLDVGTKTIGIAISDSLKMIATPKLTIKRQSNKKDFLVIQKLILENRIKALIIGLPLNMDGSESAMSKFVRKFTEELDQFLINAKIVFGDERLSSFEAEDVINEKIKSRNRDKKTLIDQIAAAVILQSVLNVLANIHS